MSAINVNKNNFNQEVLNSDKPVLMDFLGSLVWSLPHGSSSGRGNCRGALRYQGC